MGTSVAIPDTETPTAPREPRRRPARSGQVALTLDGRDRQHRRHPLQRAPLDARRASRRPPRTGSRSRRRRATRTPASPPGRTTTRSTAADPRATSAPRSNEASAHRDRRTRSAPTVARHRAARRRDGLGHRRPSTRTPPTTTRSPACSSGSTAPTRQRGHDRAVLGLLEHRGRPRTTAARADRRRARRLGQLDDLAPRRGHGRQLGRTAAGPRRRLRLRRGQRRNGGRRVRQRQHRHDRGRHVGPIGKFGRRSAFDGLERLGHVPDSNSLDVTTGDDALGVGAARRCSARRGAP